VAISWAAIMAANSAIVIGGGIAGCSTAYALAHRGIKVTLLERNPDIASVASGNPIAMLYPRLSGDDTGSEFALTAYLHSLQLYKSLNLPPEDFDCCGMLQLGFNAKELGRIQKVTAQNHAGEIVQYVNKTEASKLAGINIQHDALYLPGAAWVNPQQLCRRLSQHQNINTVTLENVIRILKVNDLFEVQTAKNTVLTAETVVIANANDARELCADLLINTQAVRGQVSLVRATESSRTLQKIVCSDGYFSPAAYLKNAEQLHCLGATFSNIAATENTQSELTITAQDHEANLQKLNNISSSLYTDLQNNIAGGRVSIRCAATDYWPLAGQLIDAKALKTNPPRPSADINALPWIDGLYMNIAHGSKGFTTAPLCGELIACMASNQALPVSGELAGLLNPNRFLLKEMGLKRLAKMVLG
jgi:tRNA 5-methylaminomethyl-2-thiouridine biosynthesis bifunctional protein